MSLGWEDGLNWMRVRLGKVKSRMALVKGASEDLARQTNLSCWEELESLMVTREAAVVA